MEENKTKGFWEFMGNAFHEHPYITWFAATGIVGTIAAIPAGIIRAIKGTPKEELPTPVTEESRLKDITPPPDSENDIEAV